MSSTCILRMEVKGKPRPRVSLRCGKARAYTPESYRGYEDGIASEYVAQGGKRYSGPVKVWIQVCRKQPKSRPKRLKFEQDVFKPDIDNIAKAVLDALNGVAYDDDSQVVYLSIGKAPRVKADKDLMVITVSGEGYE